MFGFGKRREREAEQLKNYAQIIARAIESHGHSMVEAEKLKQQDGLLKVRMLAYVDEWVTNKSFMAADIADLKRETDPFELLRKLLASYQEIFLDLQKSWQDYQELARQLFVYQQKEQEELQKGTAASHG